MSKHRINIDYLPLKKIEVAKNSDYCIFKNIHASIFLAFFLPVLFCFVFFFFFVIMNGFPVLRKNLQLY